MKNRLRVIFFLLSISLIIGVAGAVENNSEMLPLPDEFWGDVTIASSPAPAGTVIKAYINGVEFGSITTDTKGSYGGPNTLAGKHLIVSATSNVIGDTIIFTVNGNEAKEKSVFTSGKAAELDLSVDTGGGTDDSGGSGGNDGGGSGSYGGVSAGSGVQGTVSSIETQTSKAFLSISASGEVQSSLEVSSADNIGSITIPKGTKALDGNGQPLDEVTISHSPDVPVVSVPEDLSVGFVLSCGPDGATFDPAITLTYELSEEEWNEIGNAPKVIWYNPERETWNEVPATIDAATRTITAQVTHFTFFAVSWEPVGSQEPKPGAVTVTQTATSAYGEQPESIGNGGDSVFVIIGAGVVLVLIIAGFVLYFISKKEKINTDKPE